MSQFSLVKAKFIEITGRADLSDPAAAFDAGFFINEGQKFLDRLFNRGKAEARHFVNLTAGQILVPLQNVRSFKEVWLFDSETRVPLTVESAFALRGYYNEPVASLTAGAPEYYAPIVIRPYPKSLSGISTISIHAGGTGYAVGNILTIVQTGGSGGTATVTHVTGGVVDEVTLLTTGDGYSVVVGLSTTVNPIGGTGCEINVTAVMPNLNQVWAVQDVKLSGHETYNAILLKPPVDVSSKYTLEIAGLFYTDALSADADKSYWTETNELLLIFATAYMMELTYRNTEGAKDWLGSIMAIAEGLDKDIVEEQITGISSMEIKIWDTPS